MINSKTLDLLLNLDDILEKFSKKINVDKELLFKDDEYSDFLNEYIDEHYQFNTRLIEEYLDSIGGVEAIDIDVESAKLCLKYIAKIRIQMNINSEKIIRMYKDNALLPSGYYLYHIMTKFLGESKEDNKSDNTSDNNYILPTRIVAFKKIGKSLNEIYSRELSINPTSDMLEFIADDIMKYEDLSEKKPAFDILFTFKKFPLFWLKGRYIDNKEVKEIINIKDISEIILRYFKVIK